MRKAEIGLARDGDVTYMKGLAENALLDPQLRLFYGWSSALEARDYGSALGYLDRTDSLIFGTRPIDSHYGLTYELAGSPDLAQRHFEAARVQIEEALENRPNDPRLLFQLAETLPGLGEPERAVSLARRAVDMMSRSPMDRELLRVASSWIYVRAEAFDVAVAALDDYLSGPGPFSIEALSASPRFDPMRDDPGFQALLEKYRRE